jgi:hypothetical protein
MNGCEKEDGIMKKTRPVKTIDKPKVKTQVGLFYQILCGLCALCGGKGRE